MVATHQPLSNIQLELLKVYSLNVDETDIVNFKNYLAKYFMQKAIDEADKIWKEKEYSNELMNQWVNEPNQ